MEELLAEREALKQQIAALREQALSGATPGEKALAQEQLKPLLDDFRTLSVAIASGQQRATPSPAENLERLDERGDVIRAGQPNQNARVVKVRDPVTKVITDMPDPTGAAAKPTPTPADQLERIYDPNNPNRVIKLRDTATNTTIDVPDVAAGGKPTVVQGPRGEMFSWDGTKLTQLQPGTPEKPQLVQGQGGAIYTYDGKTLTEMQAGKPQPKENDSRPNVKDGYHVTESFLGGDWVVTKYGDPAKPGEPTEGMTRPNTKEGYKVTETYSGGDWTVTNVGERATPREPTTLSAPADQQFIVRTDAQGNPVNIANPNYRPKTQGDIAARVGQLQSLANAKKEEVMKKVSGTFTADQALSEFNTWWDQNVQPQTTALQAAAEEANFARGKEVAEQRRLAQTTAQNAGTLAVNAYEASKGRRVGMDADAVMKQAATGDLRGVNWQGSALYKGRDPQEIAAEAVANALKAIDPTAAQMTGGGPPTWQTTNPSDALNRTTYTAAGFGGPAAAPAAVAAAAPVAAQPDWQRADQSTGITPFGNAMAPTAGLTGTVAPDDPRFMGSFAGQMPAVADYVPPEELVPEAPVGMPVGEYPLRRRVQPVAPTVVNQDPFAQQALAAGLGAGGLGPTAPIPFYQQALAAGLGQGGLNPSRWVPPQYEYPGRPGPVLSILNL